MAKYQCWICEEYEQCIYQICYADLAASEEVAERIKDEEQIDMFEVDDE